MYYCLKILVTRLYVNICCLLLTVSLNHLLSSHNSSHTIACGYVLYKIHPIGMLHSGLGCHNRCISRVRHFDLCSFHGFLNVGNRWDEGNKYFWLAISLRWDPFSLFHIDARTSRVTGRCGTHYCKPLTTIILSFYCCLPSANSVVSLAILLLDPHQHTLAWVLSWLGSCCGLCLPNFGTYYLCLIVH